MSTTVFPLLISRVRDGNRVSLGSPSGPGTRNNLPARQPPRAFISTCCVCCAEPSTGPIRYPHFCGVDESQFTDVPSRTRRLRPQASSVSYPARSGSPQTSPGSRVSLRRRRASGSGRPPRSPRTGRTETPSGSRRYPGGTRRRSCQGMEPGALTPTSGGDPNSPSADCGASS